MGTLLDHPMHRKAPGHWNVHYNWQMASKVGHQTRASQLMRQPCNHNHRLILFSLGSTTVSAHTHTHTPNNCYSTALHHGHQVLNPLCWQPSPPLPLQLNEKPQRRALTMGNQTSETKAQFSSSAVSDADYPRERDQRPPQLAHHLEGGPTKVSTTHTNAAPTRHRDFPC